MIDLASFPRAVYRYVAREEAVSLVGTWEVQNAKVKEQKHVRACLRAFVRALRCYIWIFTGKVITALLRPSERRPGLLLASHIFRPLRRLRAARFSNDRRPLLTWNGINDKIKNDNLTSLTQELLRNARFRTQIINHFVTISEIERSEWVQ